MAEVAHDCVGALLVREGAVLLGRRSADCSWLPGAWDVFGGHVEAGETPEAALLREVAEELGVVPLDARHLATIENTGEASWRLRLYAVTHWRGELRNAAPGEHVELRWCDLAEARRLLAAAHEDFHELLARAMSLAE